MQIAEITSTVNKLSNAWEDFKVVNDRRLKDLEQKGYTNALDDEHIDRLNNAIDECENRINVIENSTYRPTLDKKSLQQQNFFRDYLRNGIEKPFLEEKNFSISGDISGIPLTQTIYDEIMIHLKNSSTMRKISSVDTIGTDYITFFKPDKEISATWGEAITKGNSPSISQKDIKTHLLHACPTITRKLLDDSAIDIDKWITNNISEAFSIAENRAFLIGDGDNKPHGLLQNTSIKNLNSSQPDKLLADDIISLYYSLGEEYVGNASFVMNRSTAHNIRSLKSEHTGHYIWQPGLQSNQDTLMGVPVYQSPEVPAFEKGKIVIAFGDFYRGYKIIDRVGISILRDEFSYKPNVAFYASKRVGGDVVDDKAVIFLNIISSAKSSK